MGNVDSINKKEVRKITAREDFGRTRGWSSAEKRQDYAEYNERKKIVFEAEARNTTAILLGRSRENLIAIAYDRSSRPIIYYI